MSDYRLGIDVGGTFTDITLLDEATGRFDHFKRPSTPHEPSQAIEDGIREILRRGVDPRRLKQLGHGTTLATNIVIERRGSRTALITTKGFRDVLEIGRQDRPHLYDIHRRKPPPIVPRYLRFEVDERIGPDGSILKPLDDAEVAAIGARLKQLDAAAVAICFLHAYRYPDHELRVRDILARALPELSISVSSDVSPEFREFERVSTTVLNAFVSPRMRAYFDRFHRHVVATGIRAEPMTLHSNGGLMSFATAARYPVRTCLSGPAAGVLGASRIAAAAGYGDAVTFDVGGTSTDVSLVVDGQPGFTTDRAIAGYPVRCPMVDVHVIGAGGGSIAWIDDAGGLHVGPRSAAAHPGPAAYGHGGVEATITDANIVLHRLNPVALLGGRMPVSEAAARAAVARRVADPLGLTVEAAALGIIRIAVANMARAIRAISIEKGHDVERFALIAYGGAGPLHASLVADEVGIGDILVPVAPGTLCARGILLSDMSRDFVVTVLDVVDAKSWPIIAGRYASLRATADAWLESEGIDPEARRFRGVVDARYAGQNHEIQVVSDLSDADDFAARFHATHRSVHGYALDDGPIELVNLRLQAIGMVARPVEPSVLPKGRVRDAIIGERPVYLDQAAGWRDVPVLSRPDLPANQPFDGPCIVEEETSTTVVPASTAARIDVYGNVIMTRRGGSR